MDNEDLGETVQRYLDMYATQDRHPQARLVIPRWASDRLAGMTPESRQEILDTLDAIASSHGLAGPVIIEVIE